MKKRREQLRKAGVLMLITFLVASVFNVSVFAGEASASTSFGTKSKNEQIKISNGVNYISEQYTNDSLKRVVNVLDVNLNNPNTKLKLEPVPPLNRLVTTTNQALANNREGHHVVGAVNASFFSFATQMPVNLVMQNNEIINYGILSPTNDGPINQPFAFGMKNGKPIIDRFDAKVTYTHNGRTIPVHSINTDRQDTELVIFTPSHRLPTVGQNASQWATEIVVTNASKDTKSISFGDTITGTVSEITRLGEGANSVIPQDGFVISANGRALADQLANVNVGDSISISTSIDATWQNADYMIATGPTLVRDGKVSISMNENSSFAKNREPRTAVAINKDGSRVFLVTIDGRQSGYSDGATLRQFAEYLINLGADRAINLDGGGSTTMVARLPGYGFPTMINKPSDTSERRVSTTLQVIDTTPPVVVNDVVRTLDTMDDVSKWRTETARATASISKSGTYEPVYEGKHSLKLSYDFTSGSTGTAAAYATRRTPVVLQGKPLQIGAWVFGDGNKHWLRGNVYDAKGQRHTIDFTADGGLDWTGWRYVRANIPAELERPLTFDRIYIAEPNAAKQGKGAIYLDQVQAIYSTSYHVNRYKDVTEKHWARTSIEYLNDNGIINGFHDGTFRPDQNITREQAAIMLVRELGLNTNNRPDPGFTDVSKTSSSYPMIAAAADEGLLNGKGKGRFEPQASLTRAELAVILQRAYTLQGEGTRNFTDLAKTHWAYDAIQQLAASGITVGYPDNTFRPNRAISRAEFSVFMHRTIQ
ncbi:S-layer homology domain-containing protein [Anaerobacillus sp. MEB173]|uniref:S-layer homology domain-containing protein n=1 Tax=Anaerobacillus sp. MEB173 TaxID=3383345 RepID=UPI003F90C573